MSNSYSNTTVTGYNSSPPADDGTQSEANKVKWSTIKTKLGDPLDTFATNVDTNIDSAFDRIEAGVEYQSFTTAGSADTYTITTGQTITPATGQILHVVFNAANTGASTLNVDSDGAAAIQYDGAALASGDLDTDGFYTLRYDGTVWEIMNSLTTATTIPLVITVTAETEDITTGTGKVTFRAPYAMTVTGVRASFTTAPTGSVATVDINESGTTILSTKLTVDAGEKTSTTAATPAVISDSAIADDAEITIDIDGVGSTVAGAGLKVTILHTAA